MGPLVGGNLADKAIATRKKLEDLVIDGVDQSTEHGQGPSGGIVDLWRVGRQCADILSDTAGVVRWAPGSQRGHFPRLLLAADHRAVDRMARFEHGGFAAYRPRGMPARLSPL